MKRVIPVVVAGTWLALLLGARAGAQAQPQDALVPGAPPVTEPPASFCERLAQPDDDDIGTDGPKTDSRRSGPRLDLTTCRSFYKKTIDANGLPIMAAGDVSDLALQRAWWIVTHVLAGRSDIHKAMVDFGTRLVIIGKDQVYTDIPEYRDARNPAFVNERVRGTGGARLTSFGEENLISHPIDRYDDESIAVHEFCHTIDAALSRIDATWEQRLEAVYRSARARGLWENAYAGTNPAEYWAELAQAYFDCNRVNNWNHGPTGHREQLKIYDPEGYELVRATFALSPEQDWRYAWVKPLPNVVTPPAKLKIDPFYKKFTYARELVVVGRGAKDAALLKANDTIRKMFAYRHDILKAFINQGIKLVVLGPGEHVSDLPEYKRLREVTAIDALARYSDYSPETNLIVVSEENVLSDPRDTYVGDDHVVRAFAKATHSLCGTRSVDPEFETRPRYLWQQYELRLQRLDVRFDDKLKALYDSAMAGKRWQGTSASNGRVAYWAAGVLAYFDAMGQDAAPKDAAHPIRTREMLAAYDPGLFALVNETMAYETRVDWRYQAHQR